MDDKEKITYFAETDARRQEAELRRQGKDPNLLYQPGSPEFYGRPENISRFKASLTDLMHGLRQEQTGPAPAMPPPKERTVDTIYQTPKGPMRWKGLGWEPVK